MRGGARAAIGFIAGFFALAGCASHVAGIHWTCDDRNECDVRATTAKGDEFQVYKGVALSPSTRALNDHVSEFRMSCGSPCSHSIFVDLDSRRASVPFENVLASEPMLGLVAVAAVGQVEIRLIFGPPERAIPVKRDFAPAAALVSAIQHSELTPEGTLKLHYLKGPEYEEFEESIPLDLASLGLRNAK